MANIEAVRAAIRQLNPRARIMDTRLPTRLDGVPSVRGQRVLAVEDGPSVTHGGLPAGAAELVARREGAVLVDPRPHARGSLRSVYDAYPTLGPVLPAMGYGAAQIAELQETIDAVPCDLVLLGTPSICGGASMSAARSRASATSWKRSSLGGWRPRWRRCKPGRARRQRVS